MKNLILLISFLLAHLSIVGQGYIHVNDPQSWQEDEGAIENLIIEVKPKGLYAEVAYTFDLSTESDFFNQGAQLEWVFGFQLDDTNLIFNDSWLWIDNYISKGVVYDKEEGVAIYEGIVNRRQDPSILTKESPTNYTLKVYPLFADSIRRVKISYLAPLEIDGQMARVNVNTSIFQTSTKHIAGATLQVIEDNNWFHFSLPSDTAEPTSNVGVNTAYTIRDFYNQQSIDLEFQRKDGVTDYFFGTYTDGEEQYFQLNFKSNVDNNRAPVYHMFVIDHIDNHQYAVDLNETLSAIERYTMSNLRDTDYVNFAYSDFGIKLYSDDYILATEENIKTAIAQMRSEIDGLGILVESLSTGISFIQDKKEDGTLTLISSDVSHGSQEITAQLFNNVEALLDSNPTDITMNFINTANYGPSFWINNTRYYGNEYLYFHLNKLTDGYSLNIPEYTINQALDQVTSSTVRTGEYDIDIEPSQGFTYGTYNTSTNGSTLSLQGDITILGKYHGAFPINVDFKGLYEGQFFEQSLSIEADQAVQLDQYAKKVWTGNYILENEYTGSPSIKKDVIESSKDERLLSSLTTFLCLEADSIQTSTVLEPNDSAGDDNTVSTDDLEANEIGIVAYPNPVSSLLTVEVPSEFYTDKMEISLYNALGMLIKTIDMEVDKIDEKYLLTWEPSNGLQSGMYIIRLMNGEQSVNLKILVQR